MEMEVFCFASEYQIITSLLSAEIECHKILETTNFAKRYYVMLSVEETAICLHHSPCARYLNKSAEK